MLVRFTETVNKMTCLSKSVRLLIVGPLCFIKCHSHQGGKYNLDFSLSFVFIFNHLFANMYWIVSVCVLCTFINLSLLKHVEPFAKSGNASYKFLLLLLNTSIHGLIKLISCNGEKMISCIFNFFTF